MSDRSSLTELAQFVGKSALASEDPLVRHRALASLTKNLQPRPARRGVADLLGALLALSARTRRMVMPKVEVDLDVFAPGGRRAVRIFFGRNRH
jgi:hypothetical protein